MLQSVPRPACVLLLTAASLMLTRPAAADCPCNTGASGPGLVISGADYHQSLQSMNTAPYGPVIAAPVPPPGTLGQTYQLPSIPVPVKKHPRTAMIDVRVVGASAVIVHDVNPMRTEDELEGFRDADDPNLWHFSTEPLYPGLPHIYRIEAQFDGPQGTTTQERFARLIRGRIVMLTF